MTETGPVTFGALLRRLRLAAGLTQEELADRAQLSVRATRYLESGRGRTPRLQTVRLLAQALDLSEAEGARLLAAAHPVATTHRTEGPTSAALLPTLNPLIGRREDLAVLKILLDDRRLVTVTGPGGVGKTRLAVEVAAQLAESFERILMVELAPLHAPDQIVSAIALSLAIHEEGPIPLDELVASGLRSGRVLLVLDNMEHLLSAWQTVLDLLTSCPELFILVTSREALHVRGERVYTLGPLALPDRDIDIGRSPAVQLFLDRAHDAGAEIVLDAETGTAIADLCSRLDGLPLAIELAAAWAPLLSPPALLARLTTRLPYLDHGPRDVPPRQRTMRDTIAWSYNLLTPEERAVFRRLSLFSGGCTVEAAMAVCEAGEQGPDLLPRLASLQSKNLLSVRESDGFAGESTRLTMLETIREYGLAMLAAESEEKSVRERYLAHFRAYGRAAAGNMVGPDHGVWQRRLERDHDNLQAALRWAIDAHDLDAAQELAESLRRFWSSGGHLSEGLGWLRQVLKIAPGDSAVSTGLLSCAAALAWEQGNVEEAVSLAERALVAARSQQKPCGSVLALNVLGAVAWQQDRYEDGRSHHEEALRLARAIEDREGELMALSNLVSMASQHGNAAEAAELAEEALAVARALGDPYALAQTLADQATRMGHLGRYDEADAMMEQALELSRSLGDTGKAAEALFSLGITANARRQYERAAALLRECLALRTDRGDERTAGATRGALAVALLNMGDLDSAEAMLDELRRSSAGPPGPTGEAIILATQGQLALARGNVTAARRHFSESVALLESIGNRQYLPWCLEGLAGVAARDRRWGVLAQLYGAREQILQGTGSSAAPICPDMFDRAIAGARSALGDETFEEYEAQGRSREPLQLLQESAGTA